MIISFIPNNFSLSNVVEININFEFNRILQNKHSSYKCLIVKRLFINGFSKCDIFISNEIIDRNNILTMYRSYLPLLSCLAPVCPSMRLFMDKIFSLFFNVFPLGVWKINFHLLTCEGLGFPKMVIMH